MRCPRCEEYRLDSKETCDCIKFIILDDEDDEHSLWAGDEEKAALRYAKHFNDEGDLLDNGITISINGNVYDLSAEYDVSYTVSKAEKE